MRQYLTLLALGRVLRKSHASKLIETGKCYRFVVTLIVLNATPESVHRQMFHNLIESKIRRIDDPDIPLIEKMHQAYKVSVNSSSR
jgi:hypothetical protein